ncbi:hypothetical protein SISNIDRAFT_552758 [Sistotremastrum niveocremeum HHB9708]|uniref:Uncharacterized protein n=2 Tax=Sistotremastraceae TaxID=3402574 RepID=A0A164NZI0_9AGAM|nr:hypothetical protein SISNIDRAFT_552758 [Sistotremastrum niveocremeum HHB9708]KZT36528.1 hypothetical protein SISSUDRAFT_1120907 [Sistotremastrum suecicum HHB10207 ss-3]
MKGPTFPFVHHLRSASHMKRETPETETISFTEYDVDLDYVEAEAAEHLNESHRPGGSPMITPILRLPPELIANIFRHFLALVLQQSDVRDVFCQLVVVAHLCRYLREVALDVPDLWIYVDGLWTPEILDEILPRSRNVPLIMVVDFEHARVDGDSSDSDHSTSHLSRLSRRAQKRKVNDTPMAEQNIRKSIAKIGALHMKGFVHSKHPTMNFSPLPIKDANLLELLYISTPNLTIPIDIENAPPKLRNIHLDHVDIRSTFPIFKNVTTLALLEGPMTAIRLSELLDVISGSPNIESLSVWRCPEMTGEEKPDILARTVNCKRLSKLDLRKWKDPQVECFLAATRFESLSEIHLNYPFIPGFSAVRPFPRAPSSFHDVLQLGDTLSIATALSRVITLEQSVMMDSDIACPFFLEASNPDSGRREFEISIDLTLGDLSRSFPVDNLRHLYLCLPQHIPAEEIFVTLFVSCVSLISLRIDRCDARRIVTVLGSQPDLCPCLQRLEIWYSSVDLNALLQMLRDRKPFNPLTSLDLNHIEALGGATTIEELRAEIQDIAVAPHSILDGIEASQRPRAR